MNTKTCTKCGIDKPLNDYYNQKNGLYGKHSRCKECSRADSRAWRESNKERHRANARAWTETNRKRVKENQRAWYEANKERKRTNARTWNEANKERKRANARVWHKANPDKARSKIYARRARKAHAVPQRWKRSSCPDHLCYWCGTTLTPNNTHIDHIMPISLGGQDTPDNTANTCAKCNLTKHNTHPLVWLARITTPDPVC